MLYITEMEMSFTITDSGVQKQNFVALEFRFISNLHSV